jgi:D-alanyl-D-alanine carboxypeptidase
MRRNRNLLVWLAPVLLCSVAFAQPRSADAGVQALRAKLEELCGPNQTVGMTAAIAREDGSIVTVSAGLADREHHTPMRPDDRMLAGSVGKMFVSATILLAVQDGSLKLDDPVQRWLGSESWYGRIPNAKDITLRMLMTHSSGIPEHVLDSSFIATLHAEPDKIWTPAEVVRYILDKPPLLRPAKAGHMRTRTTSSPPWFWKRPPAANITTTSSAVFLSRSN